MDLYKALRIATNATAGSGLGLAIPLSPSEHPAVLLVYLSAAVMFSFIAVLAWYDRS